MQLDIITTPLVNKLAEAIANDLNYGSLTVRVVADQIREDYGESVAIWAIDMATALALGE